MNYEAGKTKEEWIKLRKTTGWKDSWRKLRRMNEGMYEARENEWMNKVKKNEWRDVWSSEEWINEES